MLVPYKVTKASPLQLKLSYARIASEEGVVDMEARVIDLKLGKPGSRNRARVPDQCTLGIMHPIDQR